MTLKRRDFVRLGAVGTASVAVSSCWPFASNKTLGVEIRGLCFVDRHGNSVDVHVVDANAMSAAGQVTLLTHEPVLVVRKSDLASATAPKVDDPWDSNRWTFDITGKTIVLDAGVGGPPNLDFFDTGIDEVNGTIPATGAAWQSVRYGVRLKKVCGMANLTVDPTKVTSRITLEHGKLQSLLPIQADGTESLGTHTKWTFRNSGGAVITKQAMTNAFLCSITTQANTATFNLGAQNVVVNLPAQVSIRNLPQRNLPPGCMDHSNACADHLAAYYVLVGCTTPPQLVAERGPGGSPGIEPDYCPPGI